LGGIPSDQERIRRLDLDKPSSTGNHKIYGWLLDGMRVDFFNSIFNT
jgi:hypothetical protein